ncbi:MAG: molybdopterin-guanine dinucleotide biosynthesis protein MobB, partial [Planctomycetota bacterium]
MKFKVPVISIVGRSNSGKTTLIVKLVKELKSRGYKVATIKHSHHH